MKDLFISQRLLSSQEKKAILFLLNSLQTEKGFERLVLFGSKARGDFHKNSDVDLLAVVKKKRAEGKIYEEVARILSALGVYLSVKALSVKEFKRLNALKTPFMENIQNEGVVLWPKQ